MQHFETMSDTQLVGEYLEGNTQAFNAFYERHGKKLYNYVIRKLGYQNTHADDITQKVWEEWFGYCVKGDKEAKSLGPALLFTLANSRCLDLYRRENKAALEAVDTDTYDSEHTVVSMVEDQAVVEKIDTSLTGDTFAVAAEDSFTKRILDAIDGPALQVNAALTTAKSEFEIAQLEKKLSKARKVASELKKVFELCSMGYTRDEMADIAGLSVDQIRYRQKSLADIVEGLGLLSD